MLNQIRSFILWLIHKITLAVIPCDGCGVRGVEATSIAFPERLCKICGLIEQSRLFGPNPILREGETTERAA